MEPQRRRRWAVVLTLETVLITVPFGWLLVTTFDDPTGWAVTGLVAVSLSAFV